jgi:hypothetical protein
MSSRVYIGILSVPGQPPFTLAALDDERRLLALSQGPLAEMLAYAAGQTAAVIAIGAPRGPNQNLLTHQEALPGLKAPGATHSKTNLRLAEFLLCEKGFAVPHTPADPAHTQGWMRRGFDLHAQLEALGYGAYPGEAPRCRLETQADACFQALLGVVPFTAHTLEGRLQRQLVLRDLRLPVANAMDFFEEVTRHKLLHSILPTENLYSANELNAMMAAYIAWLAATKPQHLAAHGDPAEGQIYLPIPAADLKD